MPLLRPIARCVAWAAGLGCATLFADTAPTLAGKMATPLLAIQGAVQLPFAQSENSPQKLFAMGQTALHTANWEAAQENFERVVALHVEPWSSRAELMMIHLIGRKGDFATATSRLAAFSSRKDAAGYRCDALALWLAARSGKTDAMLSQWQVFQRTYCPSPDPEVADAIEMTVAQLLKAKNFAMAADLLGQSLEYQTSDAARIAVLRREFDLRRDPVALAAVADRYARWFPDMEETAKIQLYAAQRLFLADKLPQAQRFWEEVAGSRTYPARLREDALESAAIAAEKSGNDAVGRTMYQSLIAMTNNSFSARLKFGVYLLRTNDDPEAEKIFRDLWLSNDERRAVAGVYLLQVLVRMKKSEDARTVVAHLRDLADYGRYAEIKLAELQEAQGDLAGARAAYQSLAQRYPGDPLIAHIDYRVAVLADQLHLPDALHELVAFAGKYPADAKAPRALFRAMRCAGNADAAKPYFERIAGNYRQSPLFAAAVAQQFFFEMAAQHFHKALHLREKYPAALPDGQFGADLGLEKLHILLTAEHWSEALALGKSLMERYPTAPCAAEIAFCCGNAASTIGRYSDALADYERAGKLRPAGALGECAKGRIADMCYMLFAETQQAGYLERAEALYRELAEKSLSRAVRLEAFCRLGRTLEWRGRFSESVAAYDKALFCALEMKAEKREIEAIWCYRAAYGAIRIRIHSSRRTDREAALHAVDVLESLQLGDYGENFTALRRDVNYKQTRNYKR